MASHDQDSIHVDAYTTAISELSKHQQAIQQTIQNATDAFASVDPLLLGAQVNCDNTKRKREEMDEELQQKRREIDACEQKLVELREAEKTAITNYDKLHAATKEFKTALTRNAAILTTKTIARNSVNRGLPISPPALAERMSEHDRQNRPSYREQWENLFLSNYGSLFFETNLEIYTKLLVIAAWKAHGLLSILNNPAYLLDRLGVMAAHSVSEETSSDPMITVLENVTNTGARCRIIHPLIEAYGPEVILVLPLSEALSTGGGLDGMWTLMEVLVRILLDRSCQNSQLTGFLKALVKLIQPFTENRGGSQRFKSEMDIQDFTRALDTIRAACGLPRPIDAELTVRMAHTSSDSLAVQIAGSVSGWNVHEESAVELKGPTGEHLRVVNPSVVWERLLGCNTLSGWGPLMYGEKHDNDAETLDMEIETIRIAVHLLGPARPTRRVAILCDEKIPVIAQPGTIVGIGCYNTWNWFTTCLQVTEVEGGEPKFGRIVVYNPYGELNTQYGKKSFNQAIAQIKTAYPGSVTDDTVLENKFVQLLPHYKSSGIHAVCHALSLLHLGHPFVAELNMAKIYDVRHLIMRRTSRACLQAYHSRIDRNTSRTKNKVPSSQDGGDGGEGGSGVSDGPV